MTSGSKPYTTERRYPRYTEMADEETGLCMVIRLHAEGWNAKSIAEYLDVRRKTVHIILRQFAEEQFVGLSDKVHARKQLRKADISTIQEIKKLSERTV